MRATILGILLVVAALNPLAGQPLSCPPAANPTGRPCEAFHYHVQMYRPDTRGFVEFSGINQFSNQAACDQARENQQKRNQAVIDFYRNRKNDTQYQPDRIGSCHCDMTVDKSSPNYLTDVQRLLQLRTAEDIRQRVRERLLDAQLPSDSEILRTPVQPAGVTSMLGGPRLVPVPPRTSAAEITRAPDELKGTRSAEGAAPAVVSIELPLVDVVPATAVVGAMPDPVSPALPTSTPSGTTTTAPSLPSNTPRADSASVPPALPAPGSQPVHAPESAAAALPPTATPSSDPPVSADEAADGFVSYETQRIQHVLSASSAITDESTRAKVLEACMQRIQLLSNLRSLIQGSGARGRLAAAARSARTEEERLSMVSKLFGSTIPLHWAPKDATDVILPPDASDVDPEKILRDSTNAFTDLQKRRALYSLLAHSQPTEEQQLWLITVIDSFLQ